MKHERLILKDFFPALGENGANPTLDIYLPYNMTEMNRQNQKRPTILICPGGGYAMCSEREAEPIALHFLPEGYNAFILTYSVAPHRFPTQIREVAAAMELIYSKAEEWNCDTEKIAIIGFSAGGHLAAHYSTMYSCAEVREMFPESKPVNASILAYPVITADEQYAHMGSFENLLGHKPDEAETVKFSNDKNVTNQTPPTFLWHTAEDGAVPVMNSLLYSEALSNHKIPFELHIYPYGGHGLSTADKHTCDDVNEYIAYDSAWLANVKRWLGLIF